MRHFLWSLTSHLEDKIGGQRWQKQDIVWLVGNDCYSVKLLAKSYHKRVKRTQSKITKVIF